MSLGSSTASAASASAASAASASAFAGVARVGLAMTCGGVQRVRSGESPSSSPLFGAGTTRAGAGGFAAVVGAGTGA